MANPTLAKRKIDRLWPILIDRLWPNRLLAQIGVPVCWALFFKKKNEKKKTKNQEEQTPFGAPKGGRDQNFALFSSPATISFFLCLSVCLLVECWWCLLRQGPRMCTFGLSDCRVKPALGPPGLRTTVREPKRAHFRAPAFENTTKIQ